MKDIKCSIEITEHDGKLSIFASIPDEAEGRLVGVLTKALMGQANDIMNRVLDDNQKIEKVTRQ